MTKVQIIYWRDIPVHVRVQNGRIRQKKSLPSRFQKAVYRAAYRGKAITGDAYVQAWRQSPWQEWEGDIADVITAVSADLESAYSAERLDQLARNKGFEPHDD